MPQDIKKLAESLKGAAQPDTKQATLQAILKAVEALSALVQLLVVDRQLSEITGKIEGLTGVKIADPEAEGPKLSDALFALQEIGTSRMKKFDGGSRREFLLHRLTENFEYENAKKSNEYKTKTDTEWFIEVGVAQLAQDRSEAMLKGANPVISCFIPEESIVDIHGAQANTGTWGIENPHKNSFVVVVRPGKYQIYQEIAE